ncbi:post-PEP-CTERM-1 domain-containing protein [uncultured Massilia sp.]|uniref:post-PEP-CTERM-1 domain-containing protein n=1 Tax=uncultured Massilia sp. TaxID=169973 RepID=UPI0025F6571B|nr:hypothetical protein [uncultured Massilia sp.]
MSKSNTILRLLGAAGALALCASTLPAAAQEIGGQSVSSADAQVVTRDADTGKLRAATPQEQQKLANLKAKNAMRMAAPSTRQKTHASGGRGVRLTDEFMTSSIAVRQPDGSLRIEHGTADTLHDATHAPQHANTTPVTE